MTPPVTLLAFIVGVLAGAAVTGAVFVSMALSGLAWTLREVARKAQELAAVKPEKARVPPGLRVTGPDGKPTLELLASDPVFHEVSGVVVEAANRVRERLRMQRAAAGEAG